MTTRSWNRAVTLIEFVAYMFILAAALYAAYALVYAVFIVMGVV